MLQTGRRTSPARPSPPQTRPLVAARSGIIAHELQGTVTHEKLLHAPWAQPGYRGAWVSTQPLPVQAAAVAGANTNLLRSRPYRSLFLHSLRCTTCTA